MIGVLVRGCGCCLVLEGPVPLGVYFGVHGGSAAAAYLQMGPWLRDGGGSLFVALRRIADSKSPGQYLEHGRLSIVLRIVVAHFWGSG